MSRNISIGSEVECVFADHLHHLAIVEASGDPSEGVISWLSPVGRALLGHEEGDVIELEVPGNRRMEMKIVKVY